MGVGIPPNPYTRLAAIPTPVYPSYVAFPAQEVNNISKYLLYPVCSAGFTSMTKRSKKNNRPKKEEERQTKSRRREAEAENGKPKLAKETLHSIWGLASIGAGIILTLAGFSQAGVAGNAVYSFFDFLVGWGYALVPAGFFLVAGMFLLHKEERHLVGPVLWGIGIFIAAALGILDILTEGEAGVIGTGIGYIRNWFGQAASLIILVILAVIGLVLYLDRPLRIPKRKQEEAGEDIAAQVSLMQEREMLEHGAVAETKKEKKEQEEEKKPAEDEGFSVPLLRKSKAAPRKLVGYNAPPVDLLTRSVEKPSAGDLKASANIIKRTLESFGIPVDIADMVVGPKVTRFSIRPAEGVKLSRITALNQDLALALSAHPIRIEAPIPGKPFVGIEVPNRSAATVHLGTLVSYPEFMESGPMGFCLGKDVTGEPVFTNIEKMPHLLIAGATGSGKSITLHSVLISLLYKNSPQMLKFILIDPKRVELSAYNNLPHLIAPVVTQGKKALGVFRWAISEMDKRYEEFVHAGARDIQSFNKKNPENPLPNIVIVVDEMADLMAAYGRDVENAIVRLAQMARATGIHLILSTQRPSVEVITGLIKANITARISLQVASQIDSRTILDTAGAEKLLGGGDLLFINAQLSKPRRVQGAFITEEEIKAVTDYIKEHNEQEVSDEELSFEQSTGDVSSENGGGQPARAAEKDMFEEFGEMEEDDDLLQEAIETVRQAQKASASLLQRRLKVGYARAARLLDLMEEKNIIGPGDGAKPREVYVPKE
jgi:S-DNA-T family DNA segregation ATPase FtsK/SpoIIIE